MRLVLFTDIVTRFHTLTLVKSATGAESWLGIVVKL
ncbi:hypothetical protein CLV42_103358 [Chitinophaga ginsengisoli]|uniref:Uncharacterized protein n=1 Tax=Chitinophaga ginsengisoli TaxID=363837 RepID=A0A2P8GHF2_9BACT|nr:hypothetical protein CLV42_103358 [Chitinophaga ginsengisoli]